MKAKKGRLSGLPVSHPWIIWYAVVLHTVWGCLLLLSPSVYGPTALHIFHDLPRGLMASIFFLASGLAVWAVTQRRPSLRTLAALMPQQALLTLSAYGAVVAVATAKYGDGVSRPPAFILADQAPAIIAFILHTAAIIEIHVSRPDRELMRIVRLFREHAPAKVNDGPRAGLLRRTAEASPGDGQPKPTGAPHTSGAGRDGPLHRVMGRPLAGVDGAVAPHGQARQDHRPGPDPLHAAPCGASGY